MSRPLAPKGGNDRVYTPDEVAERICSHFKPSGRLMEPCAGKGAFLRALKPRTTGLVTTCEIDYGHDFLKFPVPPNLDEKRFDWIVTNPPWSQLRPFLNKSMELAEHVVFLCLVNAFFMRARVRDMRSAGFGIVEILYVETPPKPWPQTGFQLGAVHIRRGYSGPVKLTWL